MRIGHVRGLAVALQGTQTPLFDISISPAFGRLMASLLHGTE